MMRWKNAAGFNDERLPDEIVGRAPWSSVIYDETGEPVAVAIGRSELSLNERRALIAAAPQVVSALEGMLIEWDKLTRHGSPLAKAANERVKAARAAMAKAERR